MKAELIANTWNYEEGQEYSECIEFIPRVTWYKSVNDNNGYGYGHCISFAFLIFEFSIFFKKEFIEEKNIGFVER